MEMPIDTSSSPIHKNNLNSILLWLHYTKIQPRTRNISFSFSSCTTNLIQNFVKKPHRSSYLHTCHSSLVEKHGALFCSVLIEAMLIWLIKNLVYMDDLLINFRKFGPIRV